jgi:hypothetical protein
MPKSGLIADLVAEGGLKEKVMNPRGKVSRPLIALAATTAAFLYALPAAPLGAAEADSLTLSYGIYVSGARIYKINYSASITPDGYTTAVSMGPKGLGALFADFKLEMTSTGTLSDGKPQPVDFAMESTKKDEHKKVSLNWSFKDLPQAKRSFRVPQARLSSLVQVLQPQMLDPLTSILHHSLATDRPCSRTLRSYNGAEVYDLKLTFLGEEVIEKSKNGVYSGPAYKCKVVFVPIAGYSETKMRKHLANPPTYVVWLARIMSPTTSTSFLVPVQAVGKAKGRNFKILALDAEMSGQPLAALSSPND